MQFLPANGDSSPAESDRLPDDAGCIVERERAGLPPVARRINTKKSSITEDQSLVDGEDFDVPSVSRCTSMRPVWASTAISPCKRSMHICAPGSASYSSARTALRRCRSSRRGRSRRVRCPSGSGTRTWCRRSSSRPVRTTPRRRSSRGRCTCASSDRGTRPRCLWRIAVSCRSAGSVHQVSGRSSPPSMARGPPCRSTHPRRRRSSSPRERGLDARMEQRLEEHFGVPTIVLGPGGHPLAAGTSRRAR